MTRCVLAVTLLAAAAFAYHGDVVYPVKTKAGTPADVRLSWDYSANELSVNMTVNSTTPLSWIGMGWSPNGEAGPMVGGDYVMAYVPSGGAPCVRTLYCSTPPPNDTPVLTVEQASYTVSGGVATLRFTRGTSSGKNPIASSGKQAVLLAAASQDTAARTPASCTASLTFDNVHNFIAVVQNVSFSGM
eukprot:Rhum_TRINITY_DN19900_c0_g1::Rhum_TRINITY_DN19900_c0_g1_i1::g.170803::m.170803